MITTTPKTYYSVTETAALVRTALARKFPGIKFYVRSSNYAGGASIDVSWSFGPTSKEVNAILGQYEAADFDGMIDLETHKSHWLLPDGSTIVAHAVGTEGSRGVIPPEDNPSPPGAVPVQFGAHYVQGQRKFYIKTWEEESALIERVARDMCELNHCAWQGVELTVHLYGEGDTEQAKEHAWRLLAHTSFAPGEEYSGVRWMNEAEKEAWDESRTGIVVLKQGAPPAAAVETVAGVVIQENPEHNGIELKFHGKPGAVVLAGLKANGWRWHRVNMVWYNRMSPETKAFAERIAGKSA